jgi:hypothetical protein
VSDANHGPTLQEAKATIADHYGAGWKARSDTGCAECNRREMALHVAKLDTERDSLAIATLQERLKALEARNRDLDRRLEKRQK